MKQIICSTRLGRAPVRHDNVDFKLLYNYRNKDETLISVTKKVIWRSIFTSKLVRTQNIEYHSDECLQRV